MTHQSETLRSRLRVVHGTGAGVCVLLSLLLYVMAISPMMAHHQAQKVMQAELEAERDKARQIAQVTQRMQAELVSTERAVADYALKLEPVTALNRRVSQLTALATQIGLQINEIRPRQAQPGTFYQTVPIRVAGEGSYLASIAFIHALHATLPDISVASLKLYGRVVPGQQETVSTFEFELIWYAEPDQKSLPKSS